MDELDYHVSRAGNRFRMLTSESSGPQMEVVPRWLTDWMQRTV